jgi:hypothetical protein
MGSKGLGPTNFLPEHPINLLDFQRMFRDEEACLQYLEQLRWPEGFICEKCSVGGEPFRILSRPRVLKCRSCLYESSITAGTVMHRSKTSVHVWFWAAYLIATQTPGISALELQKRLGIARYETAFQLLHKLRAAMVRPNRDKIGDEWPLEMDIIYLGGRTKSGVQGKTNQKPAIMAVEIRRKEVRHAKTGKIIKRALAGRVRLQAIQDKSADSIDKFAKECITPGAVIVSDDGTEFTNLRSLGYDHRPVPMRGDREKMDIYLPMVSRVTANLKTWIDGTFHGVRKHHLQSYLDEFMFRFNRRFYRSISFQRLLDLGTLRVGQTYKQTYAAGTGRENSANL